MDELRPTTLEQVSELDPVEVVVSVISHGDRSLVEGFLRSLPDAMGPLTYRVVLTDNGANPAPLRLPQLGIERLVIRRNRRPQGYGANHNRSLNVVGRLWDPVSLLIINDDTILRPGSVSRLHEVLVGRDGCGAIAPFQVRGGLPVSTRLAEPGVAQAIRIAAGRQIAPEPDPAGWLQGCCLLLRSEAFAAVHGFDERFFLFYEDADLCRRLVDNGYTLTSLDDAQIEHLGHQSVLEESEADETTLQGIRSRHLYLEKHRGRPTAFAVRVAARCLLAARSIRRPSLRGLVAYDGIGVLPREQLAASDTRWDLFAAVPNGSIV